MKNILIVAAVVLFSTLNNNVMSQTNVANSDLKEIRNSEETYDSNYSFDTSFSKEKRSEVYDLLVNLLNAPQLSYKNYDIWIKSDETGYYEVRLFKKTVKIGYASLEKDSNHEKIVKKVILKVKEIPHIK